MLNDNCDVKPSENDNFRTRWSLPAGCKQMIIFPPVKEEMCTALCYLDKYSLKFRQIQFAIQTNTVCNSDKFRLKHIAIGTDCTV